jgi:hypothetical protein
VPALDRGAPAPYFYDGLGDTHDAALDFDRLPRPAGPLHPPAW